MKQNDVRLTGIGLASCLWLATASLALAGDSTVSGDTENATCPDPISWTIQALFGPVTTKPDGFQSIPRSKVIVPVAQRAGLSQKRILVFGDMYAMNHDTPPRVTDELRHLFASADLILGNIEAPITYNDNKLDLGSNQTFNFHANVQYVKSTMAQYCMDPSKTVFTVANNHAGDGGNWPSTVQYSPSLGATIVGIDKTWSPIPEITVKDVGGLKVGIVGWTHVQNNAPAVDANRSILYPSWEASLRVTPRTDWQARKQALGVNMLIGMPHWDCQFHWFPHRYTIAKVQSLHDAGFDLIAGSHPSTLQPGKLFADNKLALYSMGVLTNAINTSSNNMVTVMEIIVDQNGRTLEYTLRPYVMHKEDSFLPLANLCGSRAVYDFPRTTDWRIITLAELAKGSTDDRRAYDAFTKQLDAVFPN